MRCASALYYITYATSRQHAWHINRAGCISSQNLQQLKTCSESAFDDRPFKYPFMHYLNFFGSIMRQEGLCIFRKLARQMHTWDAKTRLNESRVEKMDPASLLVALLQSHENVTTFLRVRVFSVGIGNA